MSTINPAFLPEMRGRVERAVVAMDTIDALFTRCAEELNVTQETFAGLQKRHAELAMHFSFLESELVGRERKLGERESKRVQEQLATVQRRIEEVNQTMRELSKKMLELTRAIVLIQASPKSPEVAEA